MSATTTEKVYYKNGDVLVTSTRVILGGKTYALANITTVAIYRQSPSYVLTIPFFCSGALVGLTWVSSLQTDAPFHAALIPAVLLTGVGVVMAFLMKPRYWVRIGSSSGEANAMYSKNEGEIREIVNAVNQAIVGRG